MQFISDASEIMLYPQRCNSSDFEANFNELYASGRKWSKQKIPEPSYYYTYAECSRLYRRSLSGKGSDIGIATKESIKFLADVIKEFNITSMMDIPCGDANWQFESWETDSINIYVGADVSTLIIDANKKRYKHHSNKYFVPWDFSTCPIPKYSLPGMQERHNFDLLHVRDVLQHLPLSVGARSSKNILQSGVKYIISTTFPKSTNKVKRNEVGWDVNPAHANNLALPPYNFPAPHRCVKTHKTMEPDLTCLYIL